MRKTSYRHHPYADWLYSTRSLSLAQQGALHRLVDESWQRWDANSEPHPSLPDDDDKLKELLGESSKNWKRLRIREAVLNVFFESIDGWLVHPGSRLAAERINKHYAAKASQRKKRSDNRPPQPNATETLCKLQGKVFDSPQKLNAAMKDKSAFREGRCVLWTVPPAGKGDATKKHLDLVWNESKGSWVTRK